MAQDTRQAIIDCTIALAEKKAIRKITVRNIVDACGITRNTFYYHFHDIYDVLDSALNDKFQSAIDNDSFDNKDKAFFDIIDYCVRYKKVWKNIYKSLGHEQLSKYVSARVHSMIERYILDEADSDKVDPDDLSLITEFYEEALFGVLVRWVTNDKAYNSVEEATMVVERISAIFQGSVTLLINNAIKSRKHS